MGWLNNHRIFIYRKLKLLPTEDRIESIYFNASPFTPVSNFSSIYMGNSTSGFCKACAFTVYPHTHGEQSALAPHLSVATGLSPYTWGTVRFSTPFIGCYRFIPIHMGNRYAPEYRVRRRTVYPHTHGEQLSHHDLTS